jgi:VanZ family protein
LGSPIDLGLILVLAAYVAGLIFVGLTPFSFSPPNRVEPVTQQPGLRFDATGIATSRGEIRGEPVFPDHSVSIHLRIKPHDEPYTGLGTILSITDNDRVPPLFIAQWKSWLVVRVRDAERANRGYWELDAPGLHKGETHLVTITSGPSEGTTIYIDGLETGDTRGRSIIRSTEPLMGKLLLGCLADGSAGWRGTLSGLAIANTVYTREEVAAQHALLDMRDFSALAGARGLIALYDFAPPAVSAAPKAPDDLLLHSVSNRVAHGPLGEIEIPKTFSPLRPAIFGIPNLQDIKADWFLRDLLRNIAGFIPLGFIACLILLRNRDARGYLITIQIALLGALLSLGIETVQIVLPMRSSSLSDLYLNVIGTWVGSVMGLGLRQTWQGAAKKAI